MNIVISGVGGQGILFLSRILGETGLSMGMSLSLSEVHGMAQRGGSVVSMVRVNESASPLIPNKDADIVLSLEPIETLRVMDKISKKTMVLMNEKPVIPFQVSIGRERYPSIEEIGKILMKRAKKLILVDASNLARSLGNEICLNVVMLGASSRFLPFPKERLIQTIKKIGDGKQIEINLKAFEIGSKSTG